MRWILVEGLSRISCGYRCFRTRACLFYHGFHHMYSVCMYMYVCTTCTGSTCTCTYVVHVAKPWCMHTLANSYSATSTCTYREHPIFGWLGFEVKMENPKIGLYSYKVMILFGHSYLHPIFSARNGDCDANVRIGSSSSILNSHPKPAARSQLAGFTRKKNPQIPTDALCN